MGSYATPRRTGRPATTFQGTAVVDKTGAWTPETRVAYKTMLLKHGVSGVLTMKENMPGPMPGRRTLNRWLADARKERGDWKIAHLHGSTA